MKPKSNYTRVMAHCLADSWRNHLFCSDSPLDIQSYLAPVHQYRLDLYCRCDLL